MELNNPNAKLAKYIIDQLHLNGVREFCICPSARNAPFVVELFERQSLHNSQNKVYSFYEERSAAFFALGRAKHMRHPVAVIVTSGTAAGELLPAAMEAHQAGLPLVLVTADRPRSYRGTGAPQSAEQVGIFSVYVKVCLDIEGEERPEITPVISKQGATHLNICFDEPLLGAVSNHASPRTFQLESSGLPSNIQMQRPLIIVGALEGGTPGDLLSERERTLKLLLQWKRPVYLEALSGLREERRLDPYRVHFPQLIAGKIDGIIRIGGVPTIRLWRDLEQKYRHLEVLNISSLNFPGLSRPTHQRKFTDSLSFEFKNDSGDEPVNTVVEKDLTLYHELLRLLEAEPLSEPGLFHQLSSLLPEKSRIFLGNSLPFREWDLAATHKPRGFEIWGCRGYSGMAGQVSAFLGHASPEVENWGIFGDLTALYDLPGPWILPQLTGINAQFVVINNGGGKIFTRLFPQSPSFYFLNPHEINFEGWAKLWKLHYEKWEQIPSRIEPSATSRVIEIVPNASATQRFWKAYDAMIAKG